MHPLVRHLRALVVSAVVLFALWALVVGEWYRSEALIGAALALAAAAVAEAARTRTGVGVRVPARLLVRSASVPLLIVADFGVLVWALVRSLVDRRVVRGAIVTRAFEATGDAPEERGARAFTALAATYSPNAYVLDIDCEAGTIVLHDLVPWRPSESPA